MAESKKPAETKSRARKTDTIDPIYQKFSRSVIRALGSTEFYEYFMDAISKADNEIQFSNRRIEKYVDRTWVNEIEASLESFQKIISTPRNVIHEEELIVNVANAKKAGSDVVRHLAQHASLVEKYEPTNGDVRPSRLMQKYREDSIGLYENRLVFTVLENAHHFVALRCEALFASMSDEFGAKLRLRSDMESATEHVHMEMFLHIKDIDSTLDTDGKHISIFDRVSRLHRILSVYMNSPFAQQMAKLPRVKGAITKTNVLKKNPYYRTIVQLGEFLAEYDDIGYTINLIEQNPRITEGFQRDIFHNVLFNYLVLKGYLEREQDRKMPAPMKQRKQTLKPKFIKEIIEELTEDYDLPDVEIRKVLIEELTKEQLMHEEAEERRRLVEEQAQKRKEEQERIRAEKAAEKERLRQEREAEKERIRAEKAAEEERLRNERLMQQIEDNRRAKKLRAEMEHFRTRLPQQLAAREAALAKLATDKEKEDFADAVRLMEEAEQRRKEQAERERIRRQEERERIRREKELAAEKARIEEAERLERERIAREAEEERLRREQEAKEEQERLVQLAKDTAGTQEYYQEVMIFSRSLSQRLAMRAAQEEEVRRQKEAREAERSKRRASLFARR